MSRFVRLLPCSLLCALLAVAGCGGGDSTQNFATCGNGAIDTGERCDDANLVDTDACTSVCQPARCGDGVVEAGVEQCDGFLPQTTTCASFGLAAGTPPHCSAECTIDHSGCGPAFTPTPIPPTATITATPTATIEPTATPTPVAGNCGDGLLTASETCESCAADCVPQSCEPSGTSATFDIALEPAQGGADQVEVQVAYRTNVVNLPGSGTDTTIRQRVRFKGAAPPPGGFSVNDLDYAITVRMARPGISGAFASARFDLCTGAAAPTIEDFSCVVHACSAPAGCTCSVAPAS
jgi:cysteine-rich repeat protein